MCGVAAEEGHLQDEDPSRIDTKEAAQSIG